MSCIRAVVVAVLTAFALLWLTQLLKVSPWLAVMTMCSPWIWYYCRQLWDNSLSVPLAALLLAAYGQFLQNKRGWALCLAIVCAALSCLVHLITIPFLVVLAIHASFSHGKSVMKLKWPALLSVIIMLAISTPYLHYIVTFHGSHLPQTIAWWRGWVFPLLGAQHLTAKNVGYIIEVPWSFITPASVRYAFQIARIITYIGYIACWVGMVIAIPRAIRAIELPARASTADQLCLIALAGYAFQTIFDGIERVAIFPHYHNTTWMIFVMFVWLGLDALPRWFRSHKISARLVPLVYAASLLFVQIIIAWQIARNGGTRGNHYNAVLSNQIAVVKQIGRFSDASPIEMRVDYWSDRPDTLRVLRQLIAPPSDTGPVRKLVVKFRDAFPGDARIEVKNYPLTDSATQ
jgi:hypothetical protein